MSTMSAPACRCSSAQAAALSALACPSPENESGDALTMPMTYVRAPHGRRRPRSDSAPRSALAGRDGAGIREPPLAQRRDDERRAGDDDDARSLGAAPSDGQRLHRVGDGARERAALLGDAREPLRTDRRAAARIERREDEAGG